MDAEDATYGVAAIKLAELKRQRLKLTAYYDEVESSASRCITPLAKLETLYQGIRDAKFAQSRLHQDIPRLEVLLRQIRVATYGGRPLTRSEGELVQHWIAQLEEELRIGRRRCDTTTLFAGLLAESFAADTEALSDTMKVDIPSAEAESILKEKLEFQASFKQQSTTPASFNPDFITSTLPEDLSHIRSEVERHAQEKILKAVTVNEVKKLLEHMAGDIYLHPAMRKTAMALGKDNKSQQTEIAGALTIMLTNFTSWSWKNTDTRRPTNASAGVNRLRSECTRNKWRVYMDESFLDRLFLQLVGVRWSVMLTSDDTSNLHTMLLQNFWTSTPGRSDYSSLAYLRKTLTEGLVLGGVPNSWKDLSGPDYKRRGTEGAPSRNEKFMIACNAELQLRRATNSALKRETWATSLDFKNFFNDISREAIMMCLETLGFPSDWLNFFRRFLDYTGYFPEDGMNPPQPFTPIRGVPPNHFLSSLFAEVVCFFMERKLMQQFDGVQFRRVVDDMFFVADTSEQASEVIEFVKDFGEAMGVELNQDKCGTIRVWNTADDDEEEEEAEDEEGARGVSAGSPPVLGMLELQADGQWVPSMKMIQPVVDHLQRRLSVPQPILSIVSLYNAYCKYILHCLVLMAPMDDAYRERIGVVISGIHYSLFEIEGGIIDFLEKRMEGLLKEEEKSKDTDDWEMIDADSETKKEKEKEKEKEEEKEKKKEEKGFRVPEAWYYFPLSAGGLGLFNPILWLATYSIEAKAPPACPVIHITDDPSKFDDYAKRHPFREYYQKMFFENPLACTGSSKRFAEEDNNLLNGMIESFIKRGGKVSGNKEQDSLSEYWRWIIFSYGRQMLDMYGSFTWLPTELVPLQTISETRIEANF